MNNLDIITHGLNLKHPDTEKELMIWNVIDTANILRNIYPISIEDTDTLVNIVKEKLNKLLQINNSTWFIQLSTFGSMTLYKQENDRSKVVEFSTDHTTKSIKLLFWELLDSQEDQKTKDKYDNERMKSHMPWIYHTPDKENYITWDTRS